MGSFKYDAADLALGLSVSNTTTADLAAYCYMSPQTAERWCKGTQAPGNENARDTVAYYCGIGRRHRERQQREREQTLAATKSLLSTRLANRRRHRLEGCGPWARDGEAHRCVLCGAAG